MTTKRKRGLRYNSGKLPLHLVPPEVPAFIAAVLGYGAHKYEERNWERGLTHDQLCASLERHVLAWKIDQNARDAETGFLESLMILTNAAMIATLHYRANANGSTPIKSAEALMYLAIARHKDKERLDAHNATQS